LRHDTAEPKLRKREFVDKYINRANCIILANPIFQALREPLLSPRSTESTVRYLFHCPA
jgi:hypothetical protein